MKTKPMNNERRLAKLLREWRSREIPGTLAQMNNDLAAFLARRGVMKLSRLEREWVEQDRRLRAIGARGAK